MELIFSSQVSIVNSLFLMHFRYKYIIWLMIYWNNCKETKKSLLQEKDEFYRSVERKL